jgi:hypothetical protein
MSTIQPTDEMNAIAEADAKAESLSRRPRGDKGVEIMEKAASVEGPEVQRVPQAPEPEEPTAAPRDQGSGGRSAQVQGRAPKPICPTCQKRHHPPHIDDYNGQQPYCRRCNRRHRGRCNPNDRRNPNHRRNSSHRRNSNHRRNPNDRRGGSGAIIVSLANFTPAAARAFAEGLQRERSRSPAQRRRRDYRSDR